MSIEIVVGDLHFAAKLLDDRAPKTCAAFRALLPFSQKLIQARWSGEAAWIPLGDFDLKVPLENATSYPSRGDILFHPADASETEILFPYGSCVFASKVGVLPGSHFMTLTMGLEHLPELGRRVLYEGAQPVSFTVERR